MSARAFTSDVVVAGGGPAGAGAAAHLADAGLDVILLEQHRFPRDKICGDIIGPTGLRELVDLASPQQIDLPAGNDIQQGAIHLDGSELIAGDLPYLRGLPRYARTVRRVVLDEWIVTLARAKGVRVMEAHRASAFELKAEAVHVRVTGRERDDVIACRVLVGADGSPSTIGRALRSTPVSRRHLMVAVRAYFEDVDGPSARADMYFGSDSFPGYAWLFPTGRFSANVGVGTMLETVPPTAGQLGALLTRLVQHDPALNHRLRRARMVGAVKSWPLSTYDPHAPLVSDRVVLVGDAAGLINPLNGEGIQNALLSARWAAETIAMCAARNDFSRAALTRYPRRVEHYLGPDMAVVRLMTQAARNRALTPLWLATIRHVVARMRTDPAYAHVVGGTITGLVPATDAISSVVLRATLAEFAGSAQAWLRERWRHNPRQLGSDVLHAARSGGALVTHLALNAPAVAKWLWDVADAALDMKVALRRSGARS